MTKPMSTIPPQMHTLTSHTPSTQNDIPTDLSHNSKPVHHTYPPIHKAFVQPRSVWAIAFATMVSFMGIGLVDPILPAISHDLNATHTQAMLLFTSYLVITAIAMFFTSWVSTRIGVRTTLLIGLSLVVAFALACSASNSVNHIIGWRAGWGLGNALFISTALSAIVSAASGGSAGAIILYEAAIGIGMAFGPLAGGLLGHISWRGPFMGTAILMAIGFIGIAVLYKNKSGGAAPTGRNGRANRVSAFAAMKALSHPALRVLSLTALFYNMTFFILLAYSPFPIESAAKNAGISFGEHELGLVFFAWGICLALTSVGLAPIMTRRFGVVRTVLTTLPIIAILMLILALGTHHLWVLVATVAASGLVCGIMNTALTEAVMDATTLERHIASSAYSGVRFIGGAISSACAGPLAAFTIASMPYYMGIVCSGIAFIIVILGRKHLSMLKKQLHLSAESEATAIAAGSR
ncbi:MAG: MFS transporter [Actinomycetaceae bacterium]|nr:MFS transporter [Actinomycetaceae bacterium]